MASAGGECRDDEVVPWFQCGQHKIRGDAVACLPVSQWIRTVNSFSLTWIAYPSILCGMFGLLYEYALHPTGNSVGRNDMLPRILVMVVLALALMWLAMSSSGWSLRGLVVLLCPRVLGPSGFM